MMTRYKIKSTDTKTQLCYESNALINCYRSNIRKENEHCLDFYRLTYTCYTAYER